jgi:hypothetical protein
VGVYALSWGVNPASEASRHQRYWQRASVAVSGNGKTILVGGPDDNRNLGAVWVYTQPVFAGTPRTTDCYGESVSALSQAYGDLNAAAAALNYFDESALHDAVSGFCAGN